MSFRLSPFVLCVLLLSTLTAAGLVLLVIMESYKPLHRLGAEEAPFFADDLDINSLIQSAKSQAAYLEMQPPQEEIAFGTDKYSNHWLLLSVQELLTKLQQSPDGKEFNSFLRENFQVYQAGGRAGQRGRRMLVTGYYEPVFSGSLKKEPPYLTPLYSLPESLVTLPDQNGENKTGRYDSHNNFVSYWTRADIENNNLLQGNELVFLQDPFDAFLLHVQGSGRIRLPDRSVRSVRFAGSNGLAYKSIGKLLVDEKIMSLEEATVPAIRAYLNNHPKQRRRILQHNPRFIFFKWGDQLSPRGSSGQRLTPGRSIAIDPAALPGGGIGYLVSRRPIADRDGHISGWTTLNRFVFPQDSGAAIKGTGRVDVFWGNGDFAELAANHMKEDGRLYFLVKKGYPGAERVPSTKLSSIVNK